MLATLKERSAKRFINSTSASASCIRRHPLLDKIGKKRGIAIAKAARIIDTQARKYKRTLRLNP